MIHIDLFSGIGGFSKGLQDAGFPITKTYFSEIDKYAISVYRRNFPDAEYLGGVELVSGPRFKGEKTIITFGFPCQDLSIAGKRKGFDGSRSSLFFEAIRIIEEVRPDIFIFENVKGFYSSNNGKDFQIALQTVADLGLYECEWQLLNTAWFLPQNRERIYFVGHLGGTGGRKVFPVRESGKNSNIRQSKIAATLQHPGHSGGNYKGMNLIQTGTIGKDSEATRVYSIDGIARTIKNGGGMGAKTGLYEVKAVLTPDRSTKRQNGRRFKDDGEPSFTLTGQDKHGVAINNNIRRLTPIECERLQGFPDGWTKYGHEDQIISDSQRYKMCGNAVSVPVVKCIGERL